MPLEKCSSIESLDIPEVNTSFSKNSSLISISAKGVEKEVFHIRTVGDSLLINDKLACLITLPFQTEKDTLETILNVFGPTFISLDGIEIDQSENLLLVMRANNRDVTISSPSGIQRVIRGSGELELQKIIVSSSGKLTDLYLVKDGCINIHYFFN